MKWVIKALSVVLALVAIIVMAWALHDLLNALPDIQALNKGTLGRKNLLRSEALQLTLPLLAISSGVQSAICRWMTYLNVLPRQLGNRLMRIFGMVALAAILLLLLLWVNYALFWWLSQ